MLGPGALIGSDWFDPSCFYSHEPGWNMALVAVASRWFLDEVSDAEIATVTTARAALTTQSNNSTIRRLMAACTATNPVTLTRLAQLLQVEPSLDCSESGIVLTT